MSSLYRRNEVYWLSFRDRGKSYNISLKTKDRNTALYLKAQKDKELIEGKSFIPDNKSLCLPVLEKYQKEFEHLRKHMTNTRQCNKIKAFFKWGNVRTLKDITPDLLKEYINHRIKEENISPHTANGIIQHINTFLNWSVKNRYIFDNPIRYVKKHRVPQKDVRFLDKAEIAALLEAARKTELYVDKKPTLAPVIITGIYTGLRPQELFHLEWEDIDFDQGIVKVRNKPDFTIKDYENRAIPLHRDLKDALLPLRKEKGLCFDTVNQRRIFGRIKKAAKLTDISWYTLRHTFASHALMAGIPLVTVSKWLGHSSISTTMIYAHLLKDHHQNEIQKLSLHYSLQ